MDNASDFLEIIKQVGVHAVESSVPFGLLFGTVISTSPLKVKIDDEFILQESMLLLTNAVRDHYIWMKATDNTQDSGKGEGFHNQVTEKQNQNHLHNFSHDHDVMTDKPGTTITQTPTKTKTQSENTDHDHNYKYKGGVYLAKYGLKKDEEVILLRIQGGKKYLILDRVSPPKGNESEDNHPDDYDPDRSGYT